MAEKRRRQRGVYLQYLADIRMRRHLTQERLSALARVSRESIYRLEGGKRRADYRTAGRLAGVLGVQPEELVHGLEPPFWADYYPDGASLSDVSRTAAKFSARKPSAREMAGRFPW